MKERNLLLARSDLRTVADTFDVDELDVGADNETPIVDVVVAVLDVVCRSAKVIDEIGDFGMRKFEESSATGAGSVSNFGSDFDSSSGSFVIGVVSINLGAEESLINICSKIIYVWIFH